jgi:hypothetical protein
VWWTEELKLSRNGNECTPLAVGSAFRSGAYEAGAADAAGTLNPASSITGASVAAG